MCDQALQLHGGLGYMREAEVERQYRDQKILAIGGGTTEILTALGRQTTGVHRMTDELPRLRHGGVMGL